MATERLLSAATINSFSTTLDGNVALGDTSILLTSVTGLQAPGILCIDRTNGTTSTPAVREYISFTGISTRTLTGVTRGLGGSTAQPHNSGALVEENMSIDHWNDLIASLTVEHNSAGTHKTALVTTLKATAAEVTTGTDDTKIATPKAIKDATHTLTTPVINVGSDAQGDIYYRSAAGIFTRLAPGTSGHYLQTLGAAANPAWAAVTATALSSKIIVLTRDLSLATGNVAYTGAGFTPTSLIAFTAIQGTLFGSWGMADSAKTTQDIIRTASGVYNVDQGALISCEPTAGSLQNASVLTYDADGFTLAWTKIGTPTGTLKAFVLCYK